jgi:hypothetical protein
MSDQPARSDPIVTQRGLSERSRELLAGTRRTDGDVVTDERPYRVIRSLWWPVSFVVLGLSAADFVVVPLIWAEHSGWPTAPLVVACCGLTGAQVFLVALGLVFGRQSLASRLAVSGLLLFVVFVCWTAGYWSSVFTAEHVDLGGRRWFSLAGMAWCVLMAMLVGCVFPMSVARGLLGWRLTNPDEIRESERRGQQPENRYSLRDLLVLMTMLGVTLGVPRFTYDPRAGRYDDEAFWLGLAGCVGGTALVAAIGLTLAWYILRPHGDVRWTWTFLTMAAWGGCLLMAILLVVRVGSIPWFLFASAVWSLACMSGTVVGLLVLHAHGWRRERTQRKLRVS